MLSAFSAINRKRIIRNIAIKMNKRNRRILPVIIPMINIMDDMLTDDEIAYLSTIDVKDYTYDDLFRLTNKTTDEFDDFIDTLQKKGFIMVNTDNHNREYYGLAPIVVGWFEIAEYYHRGRPNEAQFLVNLSEVMSHFKRYNIQPLRSLVNRFSPKIIKPNQEILLYHPENGKREIPIDQALNEPVYEIHPHKTINDLIEERAKSGTIYAIGCVCRNIQRGLNNPCSFDIPVEDSCLFFADRGFGYTVKRAGYGRKISKEEAIDILQMTTEKGAVHAVFHEEDDLAARSEVAVCNCCPDCCGLLRSYNTGSIIQSYRAHYYSTVTDLNKCVGCGKCVEHCPTIAISIIDKKVSINRDRCIGCAQCTLKCPKQGVLTLVEEKRDIMLPWLEVSERRYVV